MKAYRNRSLLLAVVGCLALSLGACGDGEADSDQSKTNDINNDTGKSSDTGSADDPGDTSQTDGDDTEDSGSGESDTGLSSSIEDDILGETSQALSGIVTLSAYVDETVPNEGGTTARYGFDVDWNQMVPGFCDHLGNRVSCPSISCDPETREATLSYESSFDGCDVTGCFFASKSVSGEVGIKKAAGFLYFIYKFFNII